MRPHHWIDPSADRPSDGELRIVRLESGRIRATKWRSYDTWSDRRGCYADARGDGVGDALDPVVAVGVTWERRPKRRSGPSGKNQVPQRAVRIPDEQWQRLGDIAASEGRDRNTIINELVSAYCDRVNR